MWKVKLENELCNKLAIDIMVNIQHHILPARGNIFLHKVFSLDCSVVKSNFVISKTEVEVQRVNS